MTAHCSTNPDKMLHFVLCRFRSGLAWVERDACRVNLADTIEDIRSGELRDVVQVIEVNIAEIISRDVTEDVLQAAGRWDIASPALCPSERLAALRDHAHDLRKNWSA